MVPGTMNTDPPVLSRLMSLASLSFSETTETTVISPPATTSIGPSSVATLVNSTASASLIAVPPAELEVRPLTLVSRLIDAPLDATVKRSAVTRPPPMTPLAISLTSPWFAPAFTADRIVRSP